MGNSMYQQSDYQTAAKWYRIACKRELENPEQLFIQILGDPSEHLHRQYIKSLFKYGKTRLYCFLLLLISTNCRLYNI